MRWNLDALGMSASTLCAIHCAVTPLVLTSLPLIGLGFLANPWFEGIMITIAFGIGLSSIFPEYFHHHHRPHAMALLATGFSVMTIGMVWGGGRYEIVLMPMGGLIVASSHVVNWRFCRYADRLAQAKGQSGSCHHAPSGVSLSN